MEKRDLKRAARLAEKNFKKALLQHGRRSELTEKRFKEMQTARFELKQSLFNRVVRANPVASRRRKKEKKIKKS